MSVHWPYFDISAHIFNYQSKNSFSLASTDVETTPIGLVYSYAQRRFGRIDTIVKHHFSYNTITYVMHRLHKVMSFGKLPSWRKVDLLDWLCSRSPGKARFVPSTSGKWEFCYWLGLVSLYPQGKGDV